MNERCMYVTSCQEEDEDDFRCAEVMGDEQLDFDLFCEHTLMVGLKSRDVSRRDVLRTCESWISRA
jgi:hypothetical protein